MKGTLTVGNIDRLPPWQIKALAVRYEGMATETHNGVDAATRARFAEIAQACREHRNYPRSK